jgi:hypothetical protein
MRNVYTFDYPRVELSEEEAQNKKLFFHKYLDHKKNLNRSTFPELLDALKKPKKKKVSKLPPRGRPGVQPK